MYAVEEATWAVNPPKVARAIEMLKKQNKDLNAQGRPLHEINDETVKALYIKMGGALIGEPETYRGSSPTAEIMLENTETYKNGLAAETVKKAKKPKKAE